jgi:hypothetical protein
MILKLHKQTSDHRYPLMRDPEGKPKCYELTDKEREEATRRVDQLLRERDSERTHGYFGA